MSEVLPVIIIGAGVSGLALAQGLSKHNIPFRLFESDPTLTARTQGYRVRISDEGIDSLKQSLSIEHFQHLTSSCGSDVALSNVPQAILDAKTGEEGRPLFKPGTQIPIPLQPRYNPLSADRSVLRKVLLEGIEDRVAFGRRFKSYVETEEGTIAYFEDGSYVKGSCLVGADGVWSPVRQQLLPSYTLLDTEARLLFGKTNITETFSQEFSRKALQGLTYIRDTEFSCLLEPMRFSKNSEGLPADYVYWVLFLRCDAEIVPEDILSLAPDETAALAQKLTRHWHSSLRSLVDHANPGQASVLRVLSANPRIPNWATGLSSIGRITLIGDAAHAMCPTAALGATTALQDAHTLAMALKRHGTESAALRTYEDMMREYAFDALQKSLVGGRNVFSMRPFEELPEVKPRSKS